MTLEKAAPFLYNLQNCTGIGHIPADGTLESTQAIYDLQGRRLKELPTQKGIYIVDGKKVMVK